MGNENIVDALLEVLAINHQGQRSFLWGAVAGKHKALVAKLLARGASPNVADAVGDTPLTGLLKGRDYDPEIFDMLVPHYVADPEATEQPLNIAALKGYVEAVRSLLEKAPEMVNQTMLINGNHETPLTIACSNCNFSLAELLLEKNADPNIILKSGTDALLCVLQTAKKHSTHPTVISGALRLVEALLACDRYAIPGEYTIAVGGGAAIKTNPLVFMRDVSMPSIVKALCQYQGGVKARI